MILAIDPGNEESAWVLMDKQYRIYGFGKEDNMTVLKHVRLFNELNGVIVIERIASYGQRVGQEVFDTCEWIGRFAAVGTAPVYRVFRREVKLNLCDSVRANDADVRRALLDRFGGKGTKKEPGWFYGFKADVWQAYALGVSYIDGCKVEG